MIVFFAPYPNPKISLDGFRQRVLAIDRLFSEHERVYVRLAPSGQAEIKNPIEGDSRLEAWTLPVSDPDSLKRLLPVLLEAKLIYVQSVYSARWIGEIYRSSFFSGRVITDMHGLVPEEESYKSDANAARLYGRVEATVASGSAWLVCVTHRMERHFRQKYPEAKFRALMLPMYSGAEGRESSRSPTMEKRKPRVLYAGGTQPWQNTDRMVEFASKHRNEAEFIFLTDDLEGMAEKLKRHKLLNSVTLKKVLPERVAEEMLQADCGLIFRAPSRVNEVACPTKLVEYLECGVIPIVLSPVIGDFQELGYRYLACSRIDEVGMPSADELQSYRDANFSALKRFRQEVINSQRELREILASSRDPELASQSRADELALRILQDWALESDYEEMLLEFHWLRNSPMSSLMSSIRKRYLGFRKKFPFLTNVLVQPVKTVVRKTLR